MDLSKLSDADLEALETGQYNLLSDDALSYIENQQNPKITTREQALSRAMEVENEYKDDSINEFIMNTLNPIDLVASGVVKPFQLAGKGIKAASKGTQRGLDNLQDWLTGKFAGMQPHEANLYKQAHRQVNNMANLNRTAPDVLQAQLGDKVGKVSKAVAGKAEAYKNANVISKLPGKQVRINPKDFKDSDIYPMIEDFARKQSPATESKLVRGTGLNYGELATEAVPVTKVPESMVIEATQAQRLKEAAQEAAKRANAYAQGSVVDPSQIAIKKSANVAAGSRFRKAIEGVAPEVAQHNLQLGRMARLNKQLAKSDKNPGAMLSSSLKNRAALAQADKLVGSDLARTKDIYDVATKSKSFVSEGPFSDLGKAAGRFGLRHSEGLSSAVTAPGRAMGAMIDNPVTAAMGMQAYRDPLESYLKGDRSNIDLSHLSDEELDELEKQEALRQSGKM